MSTWTDWESRLSSVSENPAGELALLAESVLGLSSQRFRLLRLTGELPSCSAEQEGILSRLVDRRCQGEPLQYLIGSADFYGRRFAVAPGVLIPRFDTEILVDTALPLLNEGDCILDLCAGSGCIGLTLGLEKSLSVTLVEKYDGALQILKKNKEALYPSAILLQADVLQDAVDGTYDMILSNPPYIPTADLADLSPEVKREPVTALDGGDDGLLFYRAIIQRFSPSLKEGGYFLFECGIGQACALEQLLCSAGFCDTFRVRDYGGVERVVGAKKPKEKPYV